MFHHFCLLVTFNCLQDSCSLADSFEVQTSGDRTSTAIVAKVICILVHYYNRQGVGAGQEQMRYLFSNMVFVSN